MAPAPGDPTRYAARRRTMSDAQIIAMYREGVDSRTVGLHAGCSGTTVLDILHRNNEPVRPRGNPSQKPDGVALHRISDIIRLYRDGHGAPTVAHLVGCSADRVYRVLRDHGIERRSSASYPRANRRRRKGEGHV